MEKREAMLLPTASLAYLGDSVIELMVRKKLVTDGLGEIHTRAKDYVTAVAQSKAVERLESFFTEDESEVYRRGRNNTHIAPKSATHAQYSRATGLECVFGCLYLAEEWDRLDELFGKGFGS